MNQWTSIVTTPLSADKKKVTMQSLEIAPNASVEISVVFTGADPNIMDNHDRTALVIAFAMLEMDHIHVESLNRGSGQNFTSEPSSVVESIYAPLVRLLVLSDGRFPDNWSKDYSQTPAAIVQLYIETLEARERSLVHRPSKLVHLCRLAIRGHMAAVGQLHQLEQVPVPPNLGGYLQVRYL